MAVLMIHVVIVFTDKRLQLWEVSIFVLFIVKLLAVYFLSL